jgi:hypothetical protein
MVGWSGSTGRRQYLVEGKEREHVVASLGILGARWETARFGKQ